MNINFETGQPLRNFETGEPVRNFEASTSSLNFETGQPRRNFETGEPIRNFETGSSALNFETGSSRRNFETGAVFNFETGSSSARAFRTSDAAGVALFRDATYTARFSSDFEVRLNRPLRLAHVGPCFTQGGVEQHAISLAKCLNPKRVSFDQVFVVDGDQIHPDVVQRCPVPVNRVTAQQLSEAVRDFDVVLFWGSVFRQELANVSALRVYMAHGESWWTTQVLQENGPITDHVIAVSHRVRERACQGFPTSVVLNGIDPAHVAVSRSRSQARARLGFGPDDFVIGAVSRLSPEKRLPLLIEAVARLPHQFKLLIVGNSPDRAEFVDYLNTQLPGRFALVSTLDYLGDYYQSMNCFAFLSEHEGFGLSLAEAMFHGLPVITTDVGFVSELMQHRIHGLVVNPDVRDVVQSIRLVQSMPEWARGMGAQARSLVQSQLLAAEMASGYEQVLCREWQLKQQRSAHQGAPE